MEQELLMPCAYAFCRSCLSTIRVIFILACCYVVPVAARAQLPTTFQKVELVTGLKNSINFEFSPDGRIFIMDRYGEIFIYHPGNQTTVSAGIVNVFHDTDCMA